MFLLSHKTCVCVILYTSLPMEEKKNIKTLRGVVVSDKMRDTVVVAVDRYVRHPVYGKYRRITKRYKAHCPGNDASMGDRVTIASCRPISKEKYFQVVPENV